MKYPGRPTPTTQSTHNKRKVRNDSWLQNIIRRAAKVAAMKPIGLEARKNPWGAWSVIRIRMLSDHKSNPTGHSVSEDVRVEVKSVGFSLCEALFRCGSTGRCRRGHRGCRTLIRLKWTVPWTVSSVVDVLSF